MKIAPVSADLLIKIALGAALLGGTYWVLSRGLASITGAIGSLADLPGNLASKASEYVGEVADEVIVAAKEGGATWQAGYVPNPDYGNEGRNYGTPKYSNPLVNDQGYDFGQLSG
jgi:hypothetical protein